MPSNSHAASILLSLHRFPWSMEHKKSPYILGAFCGLDGTRTRDLRRDRAAF